MTYSELWRQLTAVYDEGEAKAVGEMLLEVGFGISRTEMLCGASVDESLIMPLLQRLLRGEPVQYVTGEAEFGPFRYHVAPDVLIPRPETYELCRWVAEESLGGARVLDIGTGSGCIACTLAATLDGAQLTAWDISLGALRIAAANARRMGVSVSFELRDILQRQDPPAESFTAIVSNPPYVCRREAATMSPHVLDHEPHMALFVDDDDPLRYYVAIGRYALTALAAGGSLYLEINPLYADELARLLGNMAFDAVEIRTDQFGKRRMLKAIKP